MWTLEQIAKGQGPFSKLKLRKLRRWLADDWESHDLDRDLVTVVRRLLETIDGKKVKK